MRMRNVIIVKAPRGANTVSMHARYISERERNPNREEPQTRPIFTPDRDGLKHTATDRYLAGGAEPRPKPRDLIHIIIGFNAHDLKELKRLEPSAKRRSPKIDTSLSGDKKADSPIFDPSGKKPVSPIFDLSDPEAKNPNSPNFDPSAPEGKKPDSPNFDLSVSEGKDPKSANSAKIERAAILQAQVERDLPYVRAVRLMMQNLEERTDHSELQYALTVHRHTRLTHVHVLLRREHVSKESGEKAFFSHKGLPLEFLNGRDENRKAKSGLLDHSLSDALDTMIPQRKRPLAENFRQQEPKRPDETSIDKTDQFLTHQFDDLEDYLERGQILDYPLHTRRAVEQMIKMNENTRVARVPGQKSHPLTLNPDGSTHVYYARIDKSTRTPSALDIAVRAPRYAITHTLTETERQLAMERCASIPRYSTTRKPPAPELPTAEKVLPVQPSDDLRMRVDAAVQNLTETQTDQKLTSSVQLLAQNLDSRPISNSPHEELNRRGENIFSVTHEVSKSPSAQPPSAKPASVPVKQIVILERQNPITVKEKERSSSSRSR